MVIVMQEGASDAEIQHVIDRVRVAQDSTSRSHRRTQTVLGAVGVHRISTPRFRTPRRRAREESSRITQPFKLVSRQIKPEAPSSI